LHLILPLLHKPVSNRILSGFGFAEHNRVGAPSNFSFPTSHPSAFATPINAQETRINAILYFLAENSEIRSAIRPVARTKQKFIYHEPRVFAKFTNSAMLRALLTGGPVFSVVTWLRLDTPYPEAVGTGDDGGSIPPAWGSTPAVFFYFDRD